MVAFILNALANAIGGLVAAAAFAWLLWRYNVIRSRNLERRLCSFLRPSGLSVGVDGVGVIVENKGSSTITVRSVALQVPQVGNLMLRYRPDRLGHTAPTSGSLEEQARAERGFVALPPKCEGLWNLPPALPFVLDPQMKITGCHVTFEYRDLLGGSKVVKVEADKGFAASLDGAFQHTRKEHPEFFQPQFHGPLFVPARPPGTPAAVAE